MTSLNEKSEAYVNSFLRNPHNPKVGDFGYMAVADWVEAAYEAGYKMAIEDAADIADAYGDDIIFDDIRNLGVES
jgi:hypothetical protein